MTKVNIFGNVTGIANVSSGTITQVITDGEITTIIRTNTDSRYDVSVWLDSKGVVTAVGAKKEVLHSLFDQIKQYNMEPRPIIKDVKKMINTSTSYLDGDTYSISIKS